MPQLKFFDFKTRKSFKTDDFKIVVRNGRRLAIAISPSGVKSFRILSKDFKK